jgi:hypothetical protein
MEKQIVMDTAILVTENKFVTLPDHCIGFIAVNKLMTVSSGYYPANVVEINDGIQLVNTGGIVVLNNVIQIMFPEKLRTNHILKLKQVFLGATSWEVAIIPILEL